LANGDGSSQRLTVGECELDIETVTDDEPLLDADAHHVKGVGLEGQLLPRAEHQITVGRRHHRGHAVLGDLGHMEVAGPGRRRSDRRRRLTTALADRLQAVRLSPSATR
jgi:hypothetical protein